MGNVTVSNQQKTQSTTSSANPPQQITKLRASVADVGKALTTTAVGQRSLEGACNPFHLDNQGREQR